MCIRDSCVDYLKFMLTTDNLSMMVEELNGEVLGAVKGCAVPAVLNDWFQKQFPKMPTGILPACPINTPSVDEEYSAKVEMTARGMMSIEQFRTDHDELMYKDIQMYVEQEQSNPDSELDMTDWGEPVAPSWMKQ